MYTGKLVAGTDAGWASFEYIGADGVPVRADINLAQHTADSLGVQLEIVNASFETLPTYVNNREVDTVVAAMTITEERKETMDFSIPYTIATQYIVVPAEDNTVDTIEDRGGYRIGTHLGNTGDFLICDEIDLEEGALNGTNASYYQYKSLPDASMDMRNGKLDAIVCDILLVQNLSALNPELKCFELVYEDGRSTTEELGVAMGKGETELVEAVNEIIAQLVADGTFEDDLAHYRELAAE